MSTQISEEKLQQLMSLINKFKLFLRSQDMTYTDKVVSITYIGNCIIKLLFIYKIDENLYKRAQTELHDSIVNIKDEVSIDKTFKLLQSFLEDLMRALLKLT